MELILQSLITTIVNLIIFSFIPFVWWFFRHRKQTGFFKWVGLYLPKLKSKWWILLIFIVVYYFFYKFDFLKFVFTGMGAFLLAWLNEKIYNGSIIPSIILHGAGNFIATMLVAF